MNLTPNQQAWIDALRSGEYMQGVGTLTHTPIDGVDRDCCLGVACKVAIKAGLPVEVNPRGGLVAYDDCTSSLPPSVQQWLGVASSIPRVAHERAKSHGHHGKIALSTLNDSVGATFEQIADAIEAHPEDVFTAEEAA